MRGIRDGRKKSEKTADMTEVPAAAPESRRRQRYPRPAGIFAMLLSEEDRYVAGRLLKAGIQSLPFRLFSVLPVKKNKIVFTAIEGTCGYMCNPKYIAQEFIRQGLANELKGCKLKDRVQRFMAAGKTADERYELVWLVDDTTKKFPPQVRVVRNTLWNRAYELSTAKFWIDNSRKQLECRKRNGQVYIQTWHAKLGFKPTCLDRGDSFTKIAYLVSKHDSDMVDYWLSNGRWYDRTLKRGSLYKGKVLHTGSPRCDILVKARDDAVFRERMRQGVMRSHMSHIGSVGKAADGIHFIMYAPTFRGGSQETERGISAETGGLDYGRLLAALGKRFGGKWHVLLRLHPQLAARHMASCDRNPGMTDVSGVDDMYELLAGCDAFITDYSSAAFDAAVMRMPVFLYCDDYAGYESERGSLLWDLRELPFPMAEDNDGLEKNILDFDGNKHRDSLEKLFNETGTTEDGKAGRRAVRFVRNRTGR